VFGSEELPIADSKTGARGFSPRQMEVINKSLDFKTGVIKLSLLDTAYSVASRYGVISPSSKITSATTTSAVLETSQGLAAGVLEQDKWLNYIGDAVTIRSPDGTYSKDTELTGFDLVNENMALFDAVSPAPSAGCWIELADYNKQNKKCKGIFAFLGPEIPIVSGINSTSFTVSAPDAAKLYVGDIVMIALLSDLSDNSGSVEITDITGTTITVEDMGFTPNNTYIIFGAGFSSDESRAYSIY
jgi:hypothetical protein